jgi:hypothetical protein
VIYPEARRPSRTAPARLSSPTPETRPPRTATRHPTASESPPFHSREQWRLHRPANACHRRAGRAGSRRSRCAILCCSLPTSAETDLPLQCDGLYPTCSPCQGKAIECSYGTSKRRLVARSRSESRGGYRLHGKRRHYGQSVADTSLADHDPSTQKVLVLEPQSLTRIATTSPPSTQSIAYNRLRTQPRVHRDGSREGGSVRSRPRFRQDCF